MNDSEEIINAIAYLDESGWNGFVENATSKKDIGVIAGLVIQERQREKLNEQFKEMFSHLESGHKKLHSSEIFANGKNQEIRKKILRLAK